MRAGRRAIASMLAGRAGIPVRLARRVVSAMIAALEEILANRGRLALRGFGSFAVVRRAPHDRRMPSDPPGDVQIPARLAVRFRASRLLRDRLAARRRRAGSP